MWRFNFITCFALNFLVLFESANAQDYTTFLGSSEGSALEPYKNVYANKVRIDVYYETDCPDSMKFITSQLYPLYQEMKDILDIHLYPYGKAYRYFDDQKNDYSFRCQHGPSECYGNTVQACALSLYPNMEDSLELINCMESHSKPSQNGRKCARLLGFDWEHINKCATGELGHELLHELANETEFLNPQLYFVPWVVFNRVFDQDDFRNAQRNLKGVVCNKLKVYHAKCY